MGVAGKLPLLENHSGCRSCLEKTIAFPAISQFKNQIKGRSICKVSRRGKFIVIGLDKGYLLVHLRMSGDLHVKKPCWIPEGLNRSNRHDRVALDLSGGWRLVFNDTRKFGRIWLVQNPDEFFKGLGLEPFDPALKNGGLYELLQ